MRMVQCTEYKNHFYDADKHSSCPHCAKLGLASSAPEKKGLFGRHKEEPAPPAPAYDPGDDKTVMLTNVLHEEDMQDEPAPAPVEEQIKNVAVSGAAEDVKTVALYGFDDDSDTEPVVGWLVAVSGEEKGKSFDLKSGKNSIGRSGNGTETDVSLDADHTVSRGTQAILIFEPKKKQFLLQTANGSSLVYHKDELLMNYAMLSAYDKITVGATDMLFVPFCGDKFSWEESK